MDLSFISKKIGVSENFLKEKVEEKLKELEYLIDEDTALLLVLKDLGINPDDVFKTKISDILPDGVIEELEVVVCDKLSETEKSVIYKICDDTGYAKLIVKKSIANKFSLDVGHKIKLTNVYVLRGSPIAIIVNSIKNMMIIGKKDIPKEKVHPVNILFGKILERGDAKYIVFENLVLKKLDEPIDDNYTKLVKTVGEKIIFIKNLDYGDIVKMYKDL